jgi:predicted GTPase
MVRRALIMGAAGRDFHNFNSYLRGNPNYKVVAFTAAQISELQQGEEIAKRTYPPELAGEGYPKGIRIYPESQLEELIREENVDEVFFSYSDVSHDYVMDEASRVMAAGATFILLGPKDTMYQPSKPLISVCAARTGSGKSPTSRWLVSKLKDEGHHVVVVRHPMPYGDLKEQMVQRFETLEDLDRYDCTIEEREDYEPHIKRGAIVYAGVDYEKIIVKAEGEADIIVWDGGNNDLPFFKPTLHIVIVDPLRAGDELSYYPGETNVRMADIAVISKVNTAEEKGIETVRNNITEINPGCDIVKANIIITVENPEEIKGKRAIVVEDGPTVTHGGMSYGAAMIKAKELETEIVDPRPHATGSIKRVYDMYPHLEKVLPAVGYGEGQMKELNQVINDTPADLVLLGTPTDISRYLNINKKAYNVNYELEEVNTGELWESIVKREEILKKS